MVDGVDGRAKNSRQTTSPTIARAATAMKGATFLLDAVWLDAVWLEPDASATRSSAILVSQLSRHLRANYPLVNANLICPARKPAWVVLHAPPCCKTRAHELTCVFVSCGIRSAAIRTYMCARLSFCTRCYPPRGSRDAALACAVYVTIGVTGCSDRQKRKEQRQAGSGSQRPFGLPGRLLLFHLEVDIGTDRDPERSAL